MCYSTKNKKVLGKFTDETNGVPIVRFCGLKPKRYCIEIDDKCIKKIKVDKSYAVKMNIHMQDFINC
jgi:hypothetical protein